MLIKDGNKPDKMSDGHRTYSGNDFTTRHWHFGKKSELVMEGTCLACVFGSAKHSKTCEYMKNLPSRPFQFLPAFGPIEE